MGSEWPGRRKANAIKLRLQQDWSVWIGSVRYPTDWPESCLKEDRFISFSLSQTDLMTTISLKFKSICYYYPNGCKRGERSASIHFDKVPTFFPTLFVYMSPNQLNLNGPTKPECPASIIQSCCCIYTWSKEISTNQTKMFIMDVTKEGNATTNQNNLLTLRYVGAKSGNCWNCWVDQKEATKLSITTRKEALKNCSPRFQLPQRFKE